MKQFTRLLTIASIIFMSIMANQQINLIPNQYITITKTFSIDISLIYGILSGVVICIVDDMVKSLKVFNINSS